MTQPHPFEIIDGIAVLRLAGGYRFDEASRLMASALAQACQQRHDRLLVIADELTGFAPPSIPARHQMIREWAQAAQSRVRCALVVRAEYIDPEKFGVLAASNFGLVANVFEAEADAFTWLQSLEPYPGNARAEG